MKIGQAQSTTAAVVVPPSGATPESTAAPAAAPTPTNDALPVDIVTTDDANGFTASVGNGVMMAASERSARLHELAQAVRSGNYRPSAAQLANKILEQAELDARLASSL